jgi:hypothetical protein
LSNICKKGHQYIQEGDCLKDASLGLALALLANTRKERLEGDKRTSLFVLGIDDDEKMFHNISARFGSFSTSATILPYPFTRKPIFDVRHSPIRETAIPQKVEFSLNGR